MTEEEIVRRAGEAIKRFDSLRIVGVGWSGNSRLGFAFNPESGLAGAAGGTPPPTPVTGACCLDGDCSITTQSICEAEGGDYQGDDTTCDPNPCPPEGACCVGSDCTIETEDNCTGMGGTYQGDDITCDPNPCTCCGFSPLDLFGGFYTEAHTAAFPGCGTSVVGPVDPATRFRTRTATYAPTNPGTSGSVTVVETYNSDCSEITIECSGSISDTGFLCECSTPDCGDSSSSKLECENALLQCSQVSILSYCGDSLVLSDPCIP